MTSAPHLDPHEHTTRADASARVARLYDKHARMVYGICRTILRDGHEAEDAAQQTYLLAHRALLGGANVRNEAAWLATIARNECRTRIAASMRSPLPVSDEDLEAIPTTGDEAERSEQLAAIRGALADLPERQREAVVLRDLYGLRYGEVATALGLSRAATEALLFRARRTMRQRLKPTVATMLVVPISIQEGLAQAIPGFSTAGAGGGVAAGVAGGGLLAKLTTGPVGVKVATATVAVTTVGTVGSVDSERAGRDRAERAAIVSVQDSSGPGSGDAVQGGSTRSGSDEERDDDNSGPGSDDEESRDDSSGPGGGSDDRADDRSGSGSGSSGKSPDDDASGPSLDSSGSSGSGGSGPSSSSGSSSGPGGDDPLTRSGSGSSGSGSRGSGSGGRGSSGTDPSGSGSEDSSGSGSSGSGSGDD